MRKLGTLLLSAVLIVSLASTACAVPDRMTTYMLQTILTEASLNFAIGEDTVPGDTVRQSIYDAVENDKLAPVNYFGAAVKSAAQALTGANVEAMTLCSFVSIDVSGYNPEKLADAQAVFHFTNTYPQELNFVAVVGALKGGTAEGKTIAPVDLYDWQALRAEPVADTADGIRVYFTKEALTMANDKDAVVALLCEVKPGTYTEKTIVTPGTPSKTVDDVTTIKVYDANGIQNLIIDMITPLDAKGQKALDSVSTFITADTQKIIDYFDADVAGRIQALLPNVDLKALEMNDFIETIAHNYTYAHGEVIVDATFPTVYADGTNVVALAGVFKDDGSAVWTPLKAEAVNGSVRVHYTQNAITRIEEEIGVLMILREAAE